MATQCSGRNQAGHPCGAQVFEDGLCRWHLPRLEAERAVWRERGGQNRANTVRARKQIAGAVLSPADIQGLLGATLRGVLAGQLEPGIGNAAANIARALIAVREATELEDRLTTLEAQAARHQGQGGRVA
jgi:hypothetical protein